jgi:hypothetical protein
MSILTLFSSFFFFLPQEVATLLLGICSFAVLINLALREFKVIDFQTLLQKLTKSLYCCDSTHYIM